MAIGWMRPSVTTDSYNRLEELEQIPSPPVLLVGRLHHHLDSSHPTASCFCSHPDPLLCTHHNQRSFQNVSQVITTPFFHPINVIPIKNRIQIPRGPCLPLQCHLRPLPPALLPPSSRVKLFTKRLCDPFLFHGCPFSPASALYYWFLPTMKSSASENFILISARPHFIFLRALITTWNGLYICLEVDSLSTSALPPSLPLHRHSQ